MNRTPSRFTQADKALRFRALHERKHAFIIPNPWDPGTARLLTQLGFEALATTSAGFAFSSGQKDNSIGRERMLAHITAIVAASSLPVSADLENGYGHEPESVATTIRLAAVAGAVGGSIEDATGQAERPLYELAQATDRIRAASEAARSLPFAFTLTARAENYLVGQPDIKDTIRRLQAYQEAGADVLYAPGVVRQEDIAAIISSVDRPVNVLAGMGGTTQELAVLSDLGVRRVSVGSALARTALGAFLRAVQEMHVHGTFTFAREAVSFRDITAMF